MNQFGANIIENKEGELIIAIEALSGKPETPSLVLKQGFDAVFYRTSDQFVGIENIDTCLQKKLRSVKKIMVAEVNINGETNGYYADVKELN